MDLSSTMGHSVNDGITKDSCTFHYTNHSATRSIYGYIQNRNFQMYTENIQTEMEQDSRLCTGV